MLALEISGIVLSVPEHPYEKVRKNKPAVQIEARASDPAWRAAFVIVLLGLCGAAGRLCKKWQYI